MFERMWRDDYLPYCNGVLLEREFNYLLYGILHVQMFLPHPRVKVIMPTSFLGSNFF